ncbi:MAG: CcmD family protein [Bacteroidetes bacterium]|nr:CcmD family protein [Bacteroidota bacterium]
MKKIILSWLLTLISCFCFSQEQVEMADGLRADGKIYVVVAVLVTILLGIILFLIMIDRKVSDIEKKLKK